LIKRAWLWYVAMLFLLLLGAAPSFAQDGVSLTVVGKDTEEGYKQEIFPPKQTLSGSAALLADSNGEIREWIASVEDVGFTLHDVKAHTRKILVDGEQATVEVLNVDPTAPVTVGYRSKNFKTLLFGGNPVSSGDTDTLRLGVDGNAIRFSAKYNPQFFSDHSSRALLFTSKDNLNLLATAKGLVGMPRGLHAAIQSLIDPLSCTASLLTDQQMLVMIELHTDNQASPLYDYTDVILLITTEQSTVSNYVGLPAAASDLFCDSSITPTPTDTPTPVPTDTPTPVPTDAPTPVPTDTPTPTPTNTPTPVPTDTPTPTPTNTPAPALEC